MKIVEQGSAVFYHRDDEIAAPTFGRVTYTQVTAMGWVSHGEYHARNTIFAIIDFVGGALAPKAPQEIWHGRRVIGAKAPPARFMGQA